MSNIECRINKRPGLQPSVFPGTLPRPLTWARQTTRPLALKRGEAPEIKQGQRPGHLPSPACKAGKRIVRKNRANGLAIYLSPAWRAGKRIVRKIRANGLAICYSVMSNVKSTNARAYSPRFSLALYPGR